MLLEIDDVTKTYRKRLRRRAGVRANDHISLGADGGQVYGLLGHNGSGKTTLVNQVVGLARPDSGTVRIDGIDAVASPGYARQACSLQPQAQLPIDGLKPRQAIDLMGQLRGGDKAAVKERRNRLIEALDIGEWLESEGRDLSGGVKRLVSFAMAAVVPGRVVVLDEPTNDVDPVRRRLLWGAVRELADDGHTVLLVTHNVAEAEGAVDRLAILDGGRVVAEGTPAQLKVGLERVLHLDLTLEPGVPAPAAASCVERYLPNGSRLRAIVAADRAVEALDWAQMLRSTGAIGEFSLTPASLEDVYVDIVGTGVPAAPPDDSKGATYAHAA